MNLYRTATSIALALGALIAADTSSTQLAPGAPDATATPDGRYLPNQAPVFRDQISPNADQSKPD